MSSKFTFEELDAKIGRCPMIKAHPGGYVMPITYKEDLERLSKVKLRPDDVWLVGLPKSGTTWATEMIWCIYHDGDLTKAKGKSVSEAWSNLEMSAIVKVAQYGFDEEYIKTITPEEEFLSGNPLDKLDTLNSPRFIRSHSPLSLLPPDLLDTCKVFYIGRNFKDVMVSFYKKTEGGCLQLSETFQSFVQQYLDDQGWYSPLSDHIKEAWKNRHHKNMCFLLYEDMKKDLPGTIREVAKFLNKKLTDEQVDILVNHLSVENMQKNKGTDLDEMVKSVGWMAENQHFIRKGISGDWKNHFTAELLEKYQRWWSTHMNDCDLVFEED